MKKDTDQIPDIDFGFSFVDEDADELVKQKDQNQRTIDNLRLRLKLLEANVFPFLDNLAKNPEKTTILWPNRAEKIQEFKERLEQILEGKHDE